MIPEPPGTPEYTGPDSGPKGEAKEKMQRMADYFLLYCDIDFIQTVWIPESFRYANELVKPVRKGNGTILQPCKDGTAGARKRYKDFDQPLTVGEILVFMGQFYYMMGARIETIDEAWGE